MRKSIEIKVERPEPFVYRLLSWINQFDYGIFLDSNRKKLKKQQYASFDIIAACIPIHFLHPVKNRNFDQLKDFVQKNEDWIFGYLSYDLKNEIETLTSNNQDKIHFPEILFYIPKYVFLFEANILRIEYLQEYSSYEEMVNIIEEIFTYKIDHTSQFICKIKTRLTKSEYCSTVEQIKENIKNGDIYELNFCQEFYSEEAQIDPKSLYFKLNHVSPAPFSCFVKCVDKYLISSSPERFLAKLGNKIISQPIKGTAKRGADLSEDLAIKESLSSSLKERCENIMITDLVRNDLSRTAKKGSVCVEKLCEIHTYPQVHQMISTISSELDTKRYKIIDAIKNSFPMGSMTGAPKVKAMELIERYEKTKRGLYSGAVGYITPSQDFDFNVVIRSFQYNSTNKYLSFMTGSAITFYSDPKEEYEECILKAKGLLMAVNISN